MNRQISLALLAIFSLVLFSRSLFFEFSYDDFWQIVRNENVTDNSRSAWEIFSTPTAPGNLYRPLTILSYKFNFQKFALNPLPYHCVNIVLYALLCIQVLLLFLRIFQNEKMAFLGALIFAAHPAHVEAVANVAGRAELLAGVFSLGALLVVRPERPTWRRLILSGVLLFLGALSKESALCFIFIIPLWIFWVGQNFKFAKYGFLTLAIFAALYLAIRYEVLGQGFFAHESLEVVAENPIAHLSFGLRLIPALYVLGDYLRLCLIPYPLSADYSSLPEQLLSRVYSFSGLAALVSIGLFAALVWLRRGAELGFLGLWFFLAFLTTSNIFWTIGTIMGERLLLIPSIGAVGFLLGIYAQTKLSEGFRLASLSILLALFSLLSFKRLPVWQNNYTLFAQTTLDAAQSPKAMFNFGIELYKMHELDKAQAYLRQAMELNPNYLPAAKALADIYLEKKDFGRVEYWYRRILSIDSSQADVAEALANLLKLKAH